MGCLSGRGTERGHLKAAPRMGAGGMGCMPQELKNSILPFLPQPEPNPPDRGSEDSLPQNQPSGSREGKGGTAGRALTKCLDQEGEAAPPALPVEVHFGGKKGGGGPSYL